MLAINSDVVMAVLQFVLPLASNGTFIVTVDNPVPMRTIFRAIRFFGIIIHWCNLETLHVRFWE